MSICQINSSYLDLKNVYKEVYIELEEKIWSLLKNVLVQG